MTCTHRAALKRCHELLQEAQAYVPENEAWHDQVTEILLPCDEAMECPTVPSVPAPQPWTEGELAKAMHAERLEREGCRSNYADERWEESKADRERWYASARVALSRPLAGEVVLDYAAAVSALVLVLPLAKGYAAAHPVGANQRFCDVAQDVIERYDAAIGEGKP